MRRIYRFLLIVFLCVTFASCDKIAPQNDGLESFFNDILEETGITNHDTGMIVKDVVFSPDYKTFYVTTHITRDIGPYALTDSLKTRIVVEEKINGIPLDPASSSRLLKATNTGSDEIAAMGYKVLALVDLTTGKELIERQQKMIAEMWTVFNQENLFVAFMNDGAVSETMALTPYIMENYFNNEGTGDAFLLRSVLEKEKEIKARQGLWDGDGPHALVVFTDAKVYDEDNYPIDPLYFSLKKEIVEYADSLAGENITVSFVNIAPAADSDYSDIEDIDAVFDIVSEKTKGTNQDKFNYTELQKTILGEEGDMIADDRFDFVNPDHKVYSGSDNELTISFYNIEDGKLITSATAKILKGSSFRPIIVNGISTPLVVLQGIVITAIIILIVWVIFQFIVPFVSYRVFLRKYVVSYTGPSMSVNNSRIGESCYLCKAPFEKDDKIVVKCEHTLHKECWDDNNYHCPEYGAKCKEGKHYYNYKNIYDPQNAPFYLKWIIASILAACCAWIIFTIQLHTLSSDIFEDLILGFTQVKQGSMEAMLALKDYDDPMGQAPAFGLALGFFLTLGLSIYTVRVTDFKRQWKEIAVRSILSAIACCIVFMVIAMIGISLEWELAYFVDWIPWSVCPYIMAYTATWRTPVRLKKSFYWICLGLGLVTMLLWAIQFNGTRYDYRIFQLFIFIVYSVVLSLSVAYDAPRSDHYFLRVSGGMKPMDVALYKWFKNNENYVVTIGRSVDCSLQMSWDIRNNIAPLQAEISKRHSVCVLEAIEPGIIVNGKELPAGKKVTLYNGLAFNIGDTEFTYIEKDTRRK